MALDQIGDTDSGTVLYGKINKAITEADKVAATNAALSLMQTQLAPYVDLVGSAPDRPGDAKTLFTRVMTGAPKLRPAIDKGTVENGGELGQVLRISGADTDPGLGYIDVAPRRAYYMRPGRAYLVRHAFARFQDPTDPANNAIELRFQNLGATFGIVSDVRFGDVYAPLKDRGAIFVDTFIGKSGAPGSNSYTIPATSRYGVPYFRVYGNGHQTDLGEVWLYDVTDALAGGADIASILGRVARLETAQGQSQSAGIVQRSTWSSGGTVDTALSLVTPVLNTIGRVPDTDTGSHSGISTEAGYGVPGAGLVPNAGEYAPTGTPLVWRRTGDTTAKAAAAALLSAAVVKTTIADTDYVMIPNADRAGTSLITFANFFSALEARTVPKYFRQDARGVATSSPVRWIAEDPARNGGRLYHAGATGTVLVGWGGAPVAYSQNTERLGPGDYVDLSLSELGEIWLATDGPSIPIYGFYTNSSGINVNADAAAAKFLARMSGAQTDGQRTILSTLVKDLGAAGSLKKFRTLTIFANTDQVSSIVDMARDGINVTPNAAAFTTKVGFKGNGSSATIDLGYTPAQDSRLTFSSHGFGCFVQDATTDNLGAYALGMPFLGMQVNRSGNSVAVRSGSSSPVITTVDSKGGYFSVNRSSADGFRLRHNTFTYDVVATATTLGTKVYSALALASIAVNGPEGYSTLPLGAVWYCEPLTVSEDAATQAAMTKFFNAMKAS